MIVKFNKKEGKFKINTKKWLEDILGPGTKVTGSLVKMFFQSKDSYNDLSVNFKYNVQTLSENSQVIVEIGNEVFVYYYRSFIPIEGSGFFDPICGVELKDAETGKLINCDKYLPMSYNFPQEEFWAEHEFISLRKGKYAQHEELLVKNKQTGKQYIAVPCLEGVRL